MSNVRFRYLYRDASNYKKWADVVFSNGGRLSVGTAVRKLRKGLLYRDLLIASQVRLPELFLFEECPATEDDHCFHEFHSLEVTNDPATDRLGRSIGGLVMEVEWANKNGWRAFDPLDPWSHQP